MADDSLSSWRDGPAKQAIIDFVGRTCGEDGSAAVPVEERVAVFDNDGTLWCEKPMPIQLDFILRRLAEMAQAQPELRERQPWKAVSERDYGWFGALMAEHYAGDDTNVRTLAGGILAAYAGISVEDFEAAVGHLPAQRAASDPRSRLPGVRLRTDGRAARLPGRQRLLELHRLGRRSRLHAARSARTCTASPASGSSAAAAPSPTPATTTAAPSPTSPRPTTSTTARRSRCGSGTASAGARCSRPETPTATSPMLEFTHHADRPTLRLLVLHDDAEREFDYTAGAEQALKQAEADGWTVVSIKNDWTTVF